MRNTVYCCERCGSFKVEETAWIDPNRNKISDSEPPSGCKYCSKCSDETDIRGIDRNPDGTWTARRLGTFPTLREAVRFIVKEFSW